MKEPHVLDYLIDMERNMRFALEFTDGITFAKFQTDFRNQYAVIRALEIIGESAKRIPEDIRATDPAIPWKSMAGMRDRLIHGYDNVNIELVWTTARTTIPTLFPLVAALRKKLEFERY